jgi:hypothetical protein
MDQLLQVVFEAAKTAGPFGALLGFTMWWLERSERREKEKILLKTIPDMLTAIEGFKSSIRLLTAIVQGKNGSHDVDR